MRTLPSLRAALASAGFLFVAAATAQAQSAAGVWQGVYYTSQSPGAHKVTLSISQSGPLIYGFFWAAPGVYGTGTGQITGINTIEIFWTNTPPNCTGNYQNQYTISGNRLTWTFTGLDCLGRETGYGSARRTMGLEKKTIGAR